MLLELLRLVVGRPGALAVLVFDAERTISGGASEGSPPVPATDATGGGGVIVDLTGPIGGALARPASGFDVGGGGPTGGAGLADTERGTPFGGGGVAFLTSLSFGSAFLLTHRFCSGS